MSGPCPICGVQVSLAQLEVHVNRCLDAQQQKQDERIAATLGRDDFAPEITVPYRPQQYIAMRPSDPANEEAIKRAIKTPPPIIKADVVPAPPPPTLSIPPPPVPTTKPPPPPAPKQNLVFDADASNGWVEAVRSEIVRTFLTALCAV